MATRFSPGDKVRARYDFPGKSPEDLPFKKNDQLTIIQSTKDPNWCYAQNDQGQSGMIPTTYILLSLETYIWYHGDLPRDETEQVLIGRPDGSFLLRMSQNYKGDYTLCIAHENKVEHYRVKTPGDKLTVDDERFFSDLPSLIDHYKRAEDGDGLCCQLRHPVPHTETARNPPKQSVAISNETRAKLHKLNFVIDPRNLEILELIGHGDFGDVRKGRLNGGSLVAVKTLRQGSAAAAFLQEASIMADLNHPNLVRLLGVVLEPSVGVSIITEYMTKGSLVNWLRTRGRTAITLTDQIGFALDTCKAMSYLESKNVVHRDLAARNVLLDEHTAKVSDFGLASQSLPRAEGGKFPIKWTAPEALRQNKFTSKSDVWSFGVLLWEIYTFGRIPYPKIPLRDVTAYVEKGYRMEAPESCPPPIYSVMCVCWQQTPDARPSFSQLLHNLEKLRPSVTATRT